MGKELKYLVASITGYGILLYILAIYNEVEFHPIHWVNFLLSFAACYIAFRIVFKKGRPVLAYFFCGFSFLLYTSFVLLKFVGNIYFNFYAFQYMSLFLELFMGFTIFYITVYYIFHDAKPIYQILSLFMILLPVWFYFSNEFFLNEEFVYNLRSYLPLYYFKLKIITFMLFVLAFFWANYLKSDNIFTQYLTSLMFGFSMLTAFSLLHTYSYIPNSYLANLKLNLIGQYWDFGILLFLVLVLQLKLHSVTGGFGPVYERILIHSTEHFTRRRGYFDRFICWCFFSREEIEKPLFVKKR